MKENKVNWRKKRNKVYPSSFSFFTHSTFFFLFYCLLLSFTYFPLFFFLFLSFFLFFFSSFLLHCLIVFVMLTAIVVRKGMFVLFYILLQFYRFFILVFILIVEMIFSIIAFVCSDFAEDKKIKRRKNGRKLNFLQLQSLFPIIIIISPSSSLWILIPYVLVYIVNIIKSAFR